MKKEKIFSYFLLCFPILDFFTSIATWNSSFSLGILVKGLFFLIAIFFILKENKNKWIRVAFFLLFLYFGGNMCYWYFKMGVFPKLEMIHFFKVFYLPVLILFFKDRNLDRKLFATCFLEFLILYLVPYPFGCGHNISEIYPNKNLYLSYFYVGNELANIFLLLLPISFTYFLEERKSWLFFVGIFTLCMLFLLGTKTMYFGVLFILGYFFFYYRKSILPFFKNHCLFFLLCLLLSFGGFFLFFPKTSLYQNVAASLKFYQVDSISQFLTFENIDHILYSNRLSFLKDVHEEYEKLSFGEKIMGLGKAKFQELKDIEIDFFDIFYTIGILGLFVYCFFFLVVLKNSSFSSITLFTFCFLTFISLFSGHVFLSPMTTTYLAMLFGVKNRKEEI